MEVLDTHHGALDALVSLALATKQDAETWWKAFSMYGKQWNARCQQLLFRL